MLAVLALFCFLQIPLDPVRSFDVAVNAQKAQVTSLDAYRQRVQDDEKRLFEQRFNRLVTALQEFNQEYSCAGGAVWPKAKVDAVNKAIHDLQATPSWKQPVDTFRIKKRDSHPPTRTTGMDLRVAP